MRYFLIAAAAACLVASSAHADAVTDSVANLTRQWEHVNYEVSGKSAKLKAMEELANQADAVVRQYPNRAEPLVWDAIITASAAGIKGGLGALGYVKSAREMLEKAEKINSTVLNGSVYTSLGSLYAQVPPPPIGFGDKARARAYLQRALAINPNGIDANYFYGDLLMRQHDYAGAAKALEKALAAPARPGRALADRGRRAEAQKRLAEARAKLK